MLRLVDVERAIRASWSAETAFASADYLGRAPERPSRGQCGTTALVVHDLLGGEVLVADVAVVGVVDGVHYWNRLPDGGRVDLTADQFVDGEVVLVPRVVERPGPPKPEGARAAYSLLRRRAGTRNTSLGGMRGVARTAISGHPGRMDDGRHRNGRGWAWALVGLLGLVVVIETVLLAVVASLVSLLIAIAVVVVVIVAGMLIVRDVRRHWVREPEEPAGWDELVR